MINDLVSIITPSYNAAAFIKQTIVSVQKQTYKNWEMIIVDDCSNDNTVDIVEELKQFDSRIILYKNPINLGVAETRNVALKNAKGRFIAFLDSDDLWLPNKLEQQLSFMQNANVVLSFTSYETFDSDTNKIKNVVNAPKSITPKQLLKNTIIGCLTVMVDVSKSGVIKMPNLQHSEDTLTWYNILKSNNAFAYGISEVLAQYRVSNNSLSKGKGKSVLLQWRVYRKYLNFGFLKSSFYFLSYAVNALKKRLIKKHTTL